MSIQSTRPTSSSTVHHKAHPILHQHRSNSAASPSPSSNPSAPCSSNTNPLHRRNKTVIQLKNKAQQYAPLQQHPGPTPTATHTALPSHTPPFSNAAFAICLDVGTKNASATRFPALISAFTARAQRSQRSRFTPATKLQDRRQPPAAAARESFTCRDSGWWPRTCRGVVRGNTGLTCAQFQSFP